MPRTAADPAWTDPGLLILSSLAAGAKHGYAMVQDVAATTGVHLGPGTLYGALARLEARGLVEGLRSDERRRPYRLTERGVTILAAEVERMARFATISRGRLHAASAGDVQ